MRRSLALKIGTLLLVVFTTVASAFAAPSRSREERPGPVERLIERVIQQVHRILKPLDGIALPK